MGEGGWEPFEKYYEEYDLWFIKNRVTADNELRLLKSFEIIPPSLEVGVGTGFFASQLSIDIGIDPSYNMLKKAFKRGVQSVQGIGESMPFRSEVFNTVILIVTICFLDDPILVLREIHRVLIKGGKLIVCIVPRDSEWGKYYINLGRKGHRFYKYAHFYTAEELIQLLNSCGYKIDNVKSVLSYTPRESPYSEEPKENILNYGFVCIECSKYS